MQVKQNKECLANYWKFYGSVELCKMFVVFPKFLISV